MDILFKLSGVLGLIFITIGILLRKRKYEDIFYLIGGVFLTIYSIYIRDIIFIILQIVFLAAAFYDFMRLRVIKH